MLAPYQKYLTDCTHQLLIFWKFEKLSDSRNSDQFLNTYTISYIYSWTCLKNHTVYFFSYFAKICNQKKKGGGGCIYTNSLLESQAIILVYCFIQFVKDAKILTLALMNILMSSKSETKQTLNSSITQNFEIVSLILTQDKIPRVFNLLFYQPSNSLCVSHCYKTNVS